MKRTLTSAALFVAVLLSVLPLHVAAQQQPAAGVISGVVTDADQGNPIAGAQISIAGTKIGTQTNAQGRFIIRNVPASALTVRVQMLGFGATERRVTLTSGGTLDLPFKLSMRALDLDAIVVTGTAGGLQRRAIGNVVTSVKAAEVLTTSPVTNVSQLLGQRKAGVMMMPSTGQVGTGSAVRIRGLGSITQSSDPIVYIDGVRMDSNPRTGPAQRGGANQSRLNDINPDDIESIEIIKGPAAATLYGTEASNGVIQIITKRGASGAPEFDISARLGTNWMWNPAGRASDLRWMRDPVTNEPVGFNIYENEEQVTGKPFYGYGPLQSYNLSLKGGTDALRYFTSISRDDNVGIVDWNWDKKTAMRVNLEASPSSKFTITAGGSYLKGQTRLSEGTLQTSTFHGIYRSNPRQLADSRRGWAQIPPDDMKQVEQRSDDDRTTVSLQLRYKPVKWFTNRLVTGLDINGYNQWILYPIIPGDLGQWLGPLALGSKTVVRGTQRMTTLDYSGSGNFELGRYTLQPSVGFQYYKTEDANTTATGERFPAVPITTVSGGSVRTSGELFSENATVGVFVQQQVGLNNRAFLTAAVRADDNSAFGSDFDIAIYPKLSGAWVISEEPFWHLDFVKQFRLRGAWGAAGRQPAAFAAARLYSPVIGGGNQPALVPSAYGNPDLKPERGEELELGFDATFLDGRVSLEFTRYQKSVKDAIINRELSPSSGFAGSQIVNLGLIHAWGNELGITTQLVRGSKFGWDVDVQASTMENKIINLGGQKVIFEGANAQHRVGYSIADIYMKVVLDATINANGQVLSSTCDGGTGDQGIQQGGAPVPCAQAPQLWFGKSQPTWQLGFGNTFTLFTKFRLNARVEGNGGHKQQDTSTRAAHLANTTEGTVRNTNALLLANRIVEQDRTSTYDAGFLRLREISASYDLPRYLVQKFSARRGSISLGMRNVMMLWTAQMGWGTPRDGHIVEPIGNLIIWDPETRSSAQGAISYQTVMPPTASATMTLRFSF